MSNDNKALPPEEKKPTPEKKPLTPERKAFLRNKLKEINQDYLERKNKHWFQ